MKKQIVVIGLGRFGTSLANTLTSIGHEVLAIDKDEERVQNISSQITHAVQADATNEVVLKDLGIKNFDIAIVTISSDIKSSVLATLLLKKLGINHLIARAYDDLHAAILERIGADTVVSPEREMGARVAQGVTLLHVSDYMSVIPGYGIARMKTPSHLVGKKLSEIGFGPKGKWEAAVLLLQREKEILVHPSQREAIQPDDILFVAGNNENVAKLLIEAEYHNNEDKKD